MNFKEKQEWQINLQRHLLLTRRTRKFPASNQLRRQLTQTQQLNQLVSIPLARKRKSTLPGKALPNKKNSPLMLFGR